MCAKYKFHYLIVSIIKKLRVKRKFFEDFLAEGYLAAVSAEHSFDPSRGDLTGWVYQKIYYALIKYMEKENRQKNILLNKKEKYDFINCDEIDGAHLFNKIDNETDKNILYLSCLGYSNVEIAEKYKISAERVRQRKNRSLYDCSAWV